MQIPNQSPPVERTADFARDRPAIAAAASPRQTSSSDLGNGLTASGYEECYRLRGLAQQLCLENY